MAKAKNEEEWVYKLKETHVKRVDALTNERDALKHELKYQQNLNLELMQKIRQLRNDLKDEIEFSGRKTIDSEFLSGGFLRDFK